MSVNSNCLLQRSVAVVVANQEHCCYFFFFKVHCKVSLSVFPHLIRFLFIFISLSLCTTPKYDTQSFIHMSYIYVNDELIIKHGPLHFSLSLSSLFFSYFRDDDNDLYLFHKRTVFVSFSRESHFHYLHLF
jgi:hypothetical protein